VARLYCWQTKLYFERKCYTEDGYYFDCNFEGGKKLWSIVEAIHKQTAGSGQATELSERAVWELSKHPQNFKGFAAIHHSKLLSGAKCKLSAAKCNEGGASEKLLPRHNLLPKQKPLVYQEGSCCRTWGAATTSKEGCCHTAGKALNYPLIAHRLVNTHIVISSHIAFPFISFPR
jgi:hypothetical protein